MGLQDTVSWYQRKIGTYDKQQWEKTIEQRILAGFKHVYKKTAKLKTDLIDVDLVRGSSFAKAKPKHGLATVTKLAIIRWLFLPLYWSWWIQQTCVATFSYLLFLYLAQIANVALYFYATSLPGKLLDRVSAYEVLVPAAMMLVLSLIHSEIVATSSLRQTVRCRVKRGRLGKRRTDKSRQLSEEPAKGSSFAADEVAVDGGEEEDLDEAAPIVVGVRQRSVGWRAPLRDSAPHTPPQQPLQQTTRSAEDDGFESFASHGSSEDPTTPAVEHAQAWLHGVGRSTCCPCCRSKETVHSSDTDSDLGNPKDSPQRLLQRRRCSRNIQVAAQHHYDSSCESEAPTTPPEGRERRLAGREVSGNVSGGGSGSGVCEWLGVTTNSDECSVSSDYDSSPDADCGRQMDDHPFPWEFPMSPNSTISPSCASSDRVSCTIWEDRELKRADLSMLDISSSIIARVESTPESIDYFYGGMCISLVIALLPSLCRLIELAEGETAAAAAAAVGGPAEPLSAAAAAPVLDAVLESAPTLIARVLQLVDVMFGDTLLERVVTLMAALQRFSLACLFFFLAAVAERTLKQRFLYAKLFSQLTSFRRARRSQLPHFRLNKVRNIKTWLSVRSYLKRRGPQRSVDVIVSASFIITLLLLSFITVELLKDSAKLHSEYNLEALVWCLALGVFLLRFMTLGNKTNRKYRNLSVLLTEQINLYLQIEQKPNKKEELMVANSVLKLAADLLKELESPFKISGLSTNPYLYTITKVVILSALSGVLSEMLGFKLKLHNIKISSLK